MQTLNVNTYHNVPMQHNEVLPNLFVSAGFALIVGVMVFLTTNNFLYTVIAAILVFYIFCGIRIVRPTHRVLIEFLGKFSRYGGPGFYWIIPGFQRLYAVNITEKMMNAQPQEIITKDSLNAGVDAQVYFKVKPDEANVKASQYNVFNYEDQIVNLARTTLRNIIGNMTLTEANSDRGRINGMLKTALAEETADWGIDIVRTELKEIAPPKDVQDAMDQVVIAERKKIAAQDFATAVETEADGLRRSAIKRAEGEKQAEILVAEGKASAIELVNTAAEKYFIGNAQRLKQLEVAQAAFERNTKIIVPSGQNVVNVIGNLLGVPEESTQTSQTHVEGSSTTK